MLRHPLVTVLFFLGLTLLMGLGLRNFKIDASADSLTLEYDADLDFFRELNQRYGSSDILVVTYKPRGVDLFSDESLATLKALTDDLGNIPGVTNVQSLINVPLLFSPRIEIADLKEEARTLLTPGVDRAAAKKEFQTSPIYKDLILGPDGQTTGIVATLSGDPKAVEMVRQRDALRLKNNTAGLSTEEQAELEDITQRYRDYRTRLDADNYQRVQSIRSLMDNYRDRAELFLGGATMVTADMVDYVASDMVVFGAGVIVFIILALVVIFRELRWVVLPLLSCAMAVVLMLGWLGWVDWRLTVISSNFVALLLIIAMALTIHLIVRYREFHWLHPEREQVDLVKATVYSMFRPCLYTMLTTVVAFASLVVSNIRPVIDFGWIMTIGLVVAFGLVFVIIPAFMMLVGKTAVPHRFDDDTPHAAVFADFTQNHGTLVMVISLVVGLASLAGISMLKVDNRFIDYFRENTEIYQGLSIIDANLGGTTPLDIIITKKASPLLAQSAEDEDESGDGDGGSAYADESYAEQDGADPFAFESAQADPFESGEDDPFASDGDAFGENTSAASSFWFTRAGLEELEVLHRYLEDKPEIGKVNSLVTAFHAANELTGHRMNDFELAFMRQTLSPEINSFLVAPYLNDARQETRITMRTVETASDLNRADLLKQIDTFLREEMGLEKDEYRFSGLLVLYNNMLQSLYYSQIVTMGVVFFAIMLMFVVLFRSLPVSLIAITPNVLAAAAVLGGMGLAGIPLDMMSITIAAITVGIGVDNTIHYIHRFKQEFVKDHSYLPAMHRAHRTIGKAMYYTSVIIIIGFSMLALSNFIPSIYFGVLTGIAMTMALLGAMVLLPKLILIFKPFGPEGVARAA